MESLLGHLCWSVYQFIFPFPPSHNLPLTVSNSQLSSTVTNPRLHKLFTLQTVTKLTATLKSACKNNTLTHHSVFLSQIIPDQQYHFCFLFCTLVNNFLSIVLLINSFPFFFYFLSYFLSLLFYFPTLGKRDGDSITD